MALRSRILSADAKLEAAAVSNQAHIKRGAVGEHVAKIHKALKQLDGAVIDKDELQAKKFGPSTEEAVRNYKKKRKIINRAYQSEGSGLYPDERKSKGIDRSRYRTKTHSRGAPGSRKRDVYYPPMAHYYKGFH
jgi:hypothetical protein